MRENGGGLRDRERRGRGEEVEREVENGGGSEGQSERGGGEERKSVYVWRG